MFNKYTVCQTIKTVNLVKVNLFVQFNLNKDTIYVSCTFPAETQRSKIC